MKILFVLEFYPPHIGGVEIVFKNLAEGLVKEGHEVTIVTQRLNRTKKQEIVNGVSIFRINCLSSRYLFTFLSIPKVFNLAKQADIIHTTTYNGAFPSWIAARLLRKPSIITIHEILGKSWLTFGNLNWFTAKLHQFLERLIIFLNFDCFVSVSESTKRNLLKHDSKLEKKSVVVYNGVDYDFFNSKKYDGKKIRKKLGLNKKFVYLFYGRPGISKGLEYLIKAVPKISKNIPNSKFLAIVSGHGTFEKSYEQILKLINKLNIKNNMILLNPVPRKELPNYIKAADCVVVPSLTEGFGFTAAESSAMGKAIVASNTDSLPEVVSGKYVLVKSASPKAIARGVELVYRKKVKIRERKKFSLNDNIENYQRVYKQLLMKTKQ